MNGKLTPRERFGLLLIDEEPDRIVTYPIVTSHAAKVYGCSVRDYCTEGKILANAQMAAWKRYGHDAISIFTGVGLIAEAFGSKLHFKEDDIPILSEPCLKDIDRIPELKIPDPYIDARLPVYLESIEICYETLGDILPVIVYIPAPFTTGAQLRGISNFLMDTIRNPESVHEILKLCTAACRDLLDATMQIGALPMLVDPLASASVISPGTFRDFAKPYLKELTDYLHRYDLDTMLHICGETEAIINDMRDTGTELFSFDKNDPIVTKSELGGAMRLIGNISPEEIMMLDPGQISEKVKKTVTDMKDTPKGFVISTGCEVPIRTPEENVESFIVSAHKHGQYRY
ncbi:MAG: hypothetical protein GY863_02645 [bacterium]|nr:hypothetical protein [bacterium]